VSDRTPMVELPVEAVVCPVHGEPFRAKWPSGYPIAVVRLFTAATATSEELQEAAGGDAHRLNAVIAEFGPLCRLVTAKQRFDIYSDAARTRGTEFGQHGVCAACRKWGLGSPFTARQPGGGTLTRHVCFRCVAGRPCA
jgi:hypothetical protein